MHLQTLRMLTNLSESQPHAASFKSIIDTDNFINSELILHLIQKLQNKSSSYTQQRENECTYFKTH